MIPPNADVVAARLRRVEARVAMLEDAVQVHGPPPKRSAIPELTSGQKQTIALALMFGLLLTLSTLVHYREVAA